MPLGPTTPLTTAPKLRCSRRTTRTTAMPLCHRERIRERETDGRDVHLDKEREKERKRKKNEEKGKERKTEKEKNYL
jgi:hypothetical protein